MTQEFIPYDLALELKELGFDEPCFGWYQGNRLKKEYNPLKDSGNQSYMRKEDSSAPTFSQAFKFFRDKYGLLCSPFSTLNEENNQVMFYFEIGKIKEFVVDVYSEDKFTYEEAELACLIKLIEIIKNK